MKMKKENGSHNIKAQKITSSQELEKNGGNIVFFWLEKRKGGNRCGKRAGD